MKKKLRLTDIRSIERISKNATQDAAIRTLERGGAAWGAQNGWLVAIFGHPSNPTVKRIRRLSDRMETTCIRNGTQ